MGGLGVSAPRDLLLVENIYLVKQRCTAVTVKFDDASVADYFDARVDEQLPPERFARIWVHTHPGDSPVPSWTDEKTFQRCFGGADWAVMLILAQGGQTYARLHFRAGPGGDVNLPVEIDFSSPFRASERSAWEEEYLSHVTEDRGGSQMPLHPEYGALDREPAREFFDSYGAAPFPEERRRRDPFLEKTDGLDGPLSEAGRIGAAVCA